MFHLSTGHLFYRTKKEGDLAGGRPGKKKEIGCASLYLPHNGTAVDFARA